MQVINNFKNLNFTLKFYYIFYYWNRSFILKSRKENEIYGIKVQDFSLSPDAFYNSTKNAGFFKENYIGNGVFSLKKCSGFPVYTSLPHFLYADPKFINSINGISPADPDLHDAILKIYPVIVFFNSKQSFC